MSYIYALTDTWNSAPTTFVGIGLNVTDTASAAGSLLMDLQVGGSSKFSVSKAGYGTFAAATSTQPSILIAGGGGNSGFASANGYDYFYTRAGSPMVFLGFERLDLGAGNLTWASTVGGTVDLTLTRDAANTLAQRNGTNAQTFRLYNTYTDASNYERQELTFQSNVTRWFSTAAGTGTIRNMEILRGSTQHWLFNSAGNNFGAHLLASTDNTYDIGAAGATRPRAIYVAGQGLFGGNAGFTSSGNLRMANNFGYVLPNSDGVFQLSNNATTDFSRLQFGGTTSSFPSLKRNGTALETKLADDSAYAPHAMQYLDVTDGITAPAAATGRARIYVDTADGDLKIIFADGTIKTIVTDT